MMSNVKNIYINSAPGFRDIAGTDINFTITKPVSNFNVTPKRVKLLSARIPYVWDNITTANNAFTLIEPGPVTHAGVTVPTGRYTGPTLAAALQTTLNAIPGVVNTYTVTYDPNTFKFTISAVPGTFQFNFTIADSIASALGFASIVTVSASSITSSGVANLQPDSEIFIGSTLVGGIDNGVVPYFTGSAVELNILGVVPLTSCFGSTIQYNCSTSEPWQSVNQSAFASASTINSTVVMGFNLFFLSGIPVDLKGTHWSADILLEF